MEIGDKVKFKFGNSDNVYTLKSNPYILNRVVVVELSGYEGEVNIDFLEKVE